MKRFAIVLLIAAVIAVGVAAIAGAFGKGEATDRGAPAITQPVGPPVIGPAAQQARAAALRVMGGGTVTTVTHDTTDGAAYAVDVRQPDGEITEVRLDRNYKLLGVESLQSGQDGGDAGD